CGTGIHPFINRTEIEQVPSGPDRILAAAKQDRQATVRKAVAFQSAKCCIIERIQLLSGKELFLSDQILDLRQKPGIDSGKFLNFSKRQTTAKSIGDIPQAIRTRITQL